MTDSAVHRREGWIFAGVMCLALAVRCGVAVMRAEQLTVDRDAYLGLAENLAAGNGFCTPGSTSPTAYRPPLYPLLLSAVMTILPTGIAVAAINILAGCLTVWLVSRLGDVLGLGPWRNLAALLVAVDPLLLNATPQPMTEVVFTALATAWLWSVTNRGENLTETSWRRSALTGLLFGLAALCRPTIWPLAGLMGLAWLFQRYWIGLGGTSLSLRRAWSNSGPRPSQSVRACHPMSAIFTIAATLLVVSPWVLRNQLVFGRPILMTTHGGYTLLLANNPVYLEEVVQQPWGTTWSGDSLSRWQADLEQKLHSELGPQAGELANDAWMSAKAKRYIQQHPANFLQAMVHRVRCLWSISPQGEGTLFPAAIRIGVALFYLVEYLAAIVGVWRICRRRQWFGWSPGLLLILAIQAVHLVYWTDARMRTPLQPVLALLAASAVVTRLDRPALPMSNTIKTSD